MTLKRVCDKCNRIIDTLKEDNVHVEVKIKDMPNVYRDYHLKCYENLVKKDIYKLYKIECKEAVNDDNDKL